jgi:hypothetical protein
MQQLTNRLLHNRIGILHDWYGKNLRISMRANSGLGKWTNYASNRSQPPIWLDHNQPRFGLSNATHHLFLHLDLDCFCDWYKLGNDDHHVPAHRSSVLRSLSGRCQHCLRSNCWHFGSEFTQGLYSNHLYASSTNIVLSF